MNIRVRTAMTFAVFTISLICSEAASAQICEATGGGRCFYVSPSGADELPSDPSLIYCNPANSFVSAGNPPVDCSVGGTYSAPWKNMQKAAYCAGPGDIIYLRGGNYGLSCHDWIAEFFAFVSFNDGTAAAPITLKSYPGEIATVHGTIYLGGGSGGSYHVIKDLEVSGGFINVNSAAGDQILNNNIHDYNTDCGNNLAGVRVDNGGNNILIQGNTIHDNFMKQVSTNTYLDVPSYYGYFPNCAGIVFMHQISNIVVRNNVIYNEPAGFHLKYDGEGLNDVIAGNTIHDVLSAVEGANNGWSFTNNIVYNAGTGLNIGGCNGGVAPWAPQAPCGGNNVTVAYNTISGVSEAINLKSGNPVVHHNILAAPSSNLQVSVYNGAYSTSYYSATIPDGYPNFNLSPLTLHDNCYQTAQASGSDGCGSAYASQNIYVYGPGIDNGCPNNYYTLPAAQSSFGLEQASVWADPRFVNPSAADFQLQPGSACAAMGAFAGTAAAAAAPPTAPQGLRLL